MDQYDHELWAALAADREEERRRFLEELDSDGPDVVRRKLLSDVYSKFETELARSWLQLGTEKAMVGLTERQTMAVEAQARMAKWAFVVSILALIVSGGSVIVSILT